MIYPKTERDHLFSENKQKIAIFSSKLAFYLNMKTPMGWRKRGEGRGGKRERENTIFETTGNNFN